MLLTAGFDAWSVGQGMIRVRCKLSLTPPVFVIYSPQTCVTKVKTKCFKHISETLTLFQSNEMNVKSEDG